jgi:pimeloyl-ACP methyl ester carboxylesterase
MTKILDKTDCISIQYKAKSGVNIFYHSYRKYTLLMLLLMSVNQVKSQSLGTSIKKENVTFKSEGVTLAGNIYKPKISHAALVVVHGSGQESRLNGFAELFAKNGFTVLTYDKRGVGESGGVYAGPEVGTNNIDSVNLNLLAKDASSAVNKLHQIEKNLSIGLVGFSQAGWIIPIAASKNPLIEFMVLFSCPTITTLEQLRFQFYTDGNKGFWENHTEEDVREHIKNDPDRYQFVATDPKVYLNTLSIPGLWLFGEKDIQIPVKLCIEQLNAFKVQGKPYEYTLFSRLGHSTAFDSDTAPVEISTQWIKQKILNIKKSKVSK